jgi:hypothetical protein
MLKIKFSYLHLNHNNKMQVDYKFKQHYDQLEIEFERLNINPVQLSLPRIQMCVEIHAKFRSEDLSNIIMYCLKSFLIFFFQVNWEDGLGPRLCLPLDKNKTHNKKKNKKNKKKKNY